MPVTVVWFQPKLERVDIFEQNFPISSFMKIRTVVLMTCGQTNGQTESNGHNLFVANAPKMVIIFLNFTQLVGFYVLIAVVMKSTIFWDITPCSPLKVNRRFGGTYRIYSQGRSKQSSACHLFSRSGSGTVEQSSLKVSCLFCKY
jgi:hypothetical protein